ncbi:hypothetical protein AB7M26_003829 [Pseudomonas sp. F-14 TE3482]|jgi:hypothetical protein|uniref:Uncharacterized protein n=1 Tax=Pseudomonas frederiksbergensis TaxID=104087 RepID=A0A423JDH4_9PSED|nr:hypothetical protein BK661_05210 [Pseudomonas frederiksbergensis]
MIYAVFASTRGMLPSMWMLIDFMVEQFKLLDDDEGRLASGLAKAKPGDVWESSEVVVFRLILRGCFSLRRVSRKWLLFWAKFSPWRASALGPGCVKTH